MSRHRGAQRLILALLVLGCITSAVGAAARAQRMIAPGVSHAAEWRVQGPLNINVIELDPKEKYISLACTVGGSGIGRRAVSDIAGTTSGPERYAVAAVNGDYFVMDGTCSGALLGLNLSAGQLLSARSGRSALAILEDGRAQIVRMRVDGQIETAGGQRIEIAAINQPRGHSDTVLYTAAFGSSTRTPPSGREVVLAGVPQPLELGRVYEASVTASTHAVGDLALGPDVVVVSAAGRGAAGLARLAVGDKVKVCVDLAPRLPARIVEAVGGGPRLVRDGRVSVEWTQESLPATHALNRHPRTAAGIKSDGHILLVTVDGRQLASAGMTLHELAQLMIELGCRDAVNLDGGGSTTMWVRGQVVNRPSGGSQRPVANALLVMSSAPHGPATRVRVDPESISALPGYRAAIKAEAEDDYYNPVASAGNGVAWAYEGAIGSVSPQGEFVAGDVADTVTGTVKVTIAGATAQVPVTVYARPARLQIMPESVAAEAGRQLRFQVTPLDGDGRPIGFARDQVEWLADGAAGLMAAPGLLTAGTGPAGTVTATLRGVQATAWVTFAAAPTMTATPVEDFETAISGSAYAWPRELPVTAERVTEPVHSGAYAARLKYDFTTTTEARAAYLPVDRDLGAALRLRVWVYGDGLGHWLRARITDGSGQTLNLDLAPRVDWSGWREVMAAVPPEAKAPIHWEAIYVSESRADRQDSGALVFDSLQADLAASDATSR